jgi:hypothetical protein
VPPLKPLPISCPVSAEPLLSLQRRLRVCRTCPIRCFADGLFAVFRGSGYRQRLLGRVLLHSLDELFQPLDTTVLTTVEVRFRQKLLKVISAGPRATSSVVGRHQCASRSSPFTPLRTPPRTPCLVEPSQYGDASSWAKSGVLLGILRA